MLRNFEIIELPADELCTFIGNKSRATWVCAAIEVCSRLWAGSVLGRRSSRNATAVLNDVILRGRVVGFPLIATDGFEYYVGVIERLFGSAGALYAFHVAVVRVPVAVQLMQTSPAALSSFSWPHEHRSAA